MAQLKAKITLKTKGEAAYVSVKQLMVSLRWTSQVDLDLMAFYRTKDGRDGGVFSNNFEGGTLGSLNAFPFIQLSGDEGVGASGGDNEETLRIAKLDDMAEVYICALNYTDAIQGKAASFSAYDGGVVVLDDKGESVAVPLNSPDAGIVAVIAKIDNQNPLGAKLINENRVLDLNTFVADVPGAHLITK